MSQRVTPGERLSTTMLGLLAVVCLVWWLGWRGGRFEMLVYPEPRAIYSVKEVMHRTLVTQSVILLSAVLLLCSILVWWHRVSRHHGLRPAMLRWALNIVSCLVIMLTMLDLRDKSLYTAEAWVVFAAIALVALLDIVRASTSSSSE